jgi:beta-glucuronidase
MSRLFQEHDQRLVTHLDGVWDFVYLGSRGPAAIDMDQLSYDDRMVVPGCFDATPHYKGLRGLAAYRTWVNIQDALPHRLVFNGVNHWCQAFLNGKDLGVHQGGFTRFHFDIWDHDPGIQELVVLVHNLTDYDHCPLHLDHFDWYQFGGISRGVELHNLGRTWIDDLRVITENIDPPEIKITITVASIEPPGESTLKITWDGNTVVEEKITLSGSSRNITRRIRIPETTLWSPANPNLHMLHISLGKDDIRERIGIRKIQTKGSQLLINDKPIRLIGFNRHESHPLFGHSQPDALLMTDIQQLRDLGCNFVRGSHYPQDLRFLDLCDEMGICVWSEAIGWQHTAEHLTDPVFIDAQKRHINEMIRSATNRASVILWGLLNESHSHDHRNIQAYRDLIEYIRSVDPTRPVTYASNHPFDDLCFDLVDIISINTYPGWYIGDISEMPAVVDGILDHLDNQFETHKPIIISEIGAGAIPGWRDENEGRWTEQYQARLLEAVIQHLLMDQQRVSGLSIWLYNDFRTNDNVMRPRGFNNKGVVDEYRRPKMAYQVIKNLYQHLRKSGI